MRVTICQRALTVGLMILVAAGLWHPVRGEEQDTSATIEDAARRRYEAALQDRAAEEARISQAREEFEAREGTEPLVPREYLLSFSSATSVDRVFRSLAENPEIVVEEVFSWVRANGSLFPKTGIHRAEEFDWPTNDPNGVDEHIRHVVVTFLQDTLRNIDEELSRTRSAPARLLNQRQEVAELLTIVPVSGAELYGLRCTCSPQAIRDFDQSSDVDIRTAEPVDGSDPKARRPIWPADPLREQIIATGGHYGL